MKIIIQPSIISGTILAPASKSSMQRACAAALLSKNECHIFNPGHSNDDKAALDIIQKLGATVTVIDENVIIINSDYTRHSNIQSVSDSINCGESGLSIRMFTPIAALAENPITIKGEGSLTIRPMNFFDEILPLLDVKIQSNEGKLPMQIHGPLKAKNITVDGSLSSQFLTGLLMAYAASAISEEITITVKDLKSKPYIDLTLDVMHNFGLSVPENKNYEQFIFKKSELENSKDSKIHYTVEGDWSGGAFLLVAGAICGNIKVRGLQINSTQADKAILDALIAANAGITIDAKEISLHAASLKAFNFDATDCPDLFPPLVALASYCDGITVIKGVSRLAHKESNRGLTLQEEFGKMGVKIELIGDEMKIHGGVGVKGADVHSRHDHRIAMACAVAALKADGITTIEDAEAINKSYPDFYKHIEILGASIEAEDIEIIIPKH
ncbi:MAG: 3-phosphoshikimate 1-carboxyvinyltransferase [Chitinophagaceae bacterium]|nr:MAG: 3-phosphoshikimate 1-carboxyvinyltransferase [Chitinophagaceae bacterium]